LKSISTQGNRVPETLTTWVSARIFPYYINIFQTSLHKYISKVFDYLKKDYYQCIVGFKQFVVAKHIAKRQVGRNGHTLL
jgi:hypothetical protein